MADEPTITAEKIKAQLAAALAAGPNAPRPALDRRPDPGFRFTKGDRVLDLIAGERGTVEEFYQSATNQGPVYEIRIAPGRAIVRLERELERDGAQNVPAALPRI
jgi:hypothetical protein